MSDFLVVVVVPSFRSEGLRIPVAIVVLVFDGDALLVLWRGLVAGHEDDGLHVETPQTIMTFTP